MAESTPIALDSLVVAAPDPITAELDGELILLGLKQGAYYGFADTARFIWQQIQQPQRVGALCAQMMTVFDIDAESCAAEVCAFLESLRSEGLLEVLAQTAPPASDLP